MKLLVAAPRGFCAGVDRAIEIVEKYLQKYGKPVYVRHEIVHNKYVVEDLEKKGVLISNMGGGKLRMVTHLDYNLEMHEKLMEILESIS